MGIDGQWVDDRQLLIPQENFIRQDLNQRISVNRKFDLCQLLEVAEHLKAERALTFIEDLTKLLDIVLFGVAVSYQGRPSET